MKFDHLSLDDTHRRLIQRVSPPGAATIFLAPLDKGLSGASVWLAQWAKGKGVRTSPSVLKIGEKKKIRIEFEAYNNIVKDLTADIGPFDVYYRDSVGILRQPFRGHKDFTIRNLGHYLRNVSSTTETEGIIHRLYSQHMEHWHPVPKGRRRRRKKIGAALRWWRSRYDLQDAFRNLGPTGVSDELQERFDTDIAELDRFVKECLDTYVDMVIGPIHGDLHAQNILVDADGTIHLIDFAWSCENWKAIDFLMLECSLKFLVAPMNARQRDLLVLEELIDFGIPDGACIKHDAHIYGHELKTITAAINKIRRICEEREYIANHADYLRGLVALTGCLASLPLLNRRFLINSLAYNMRKLKELG